MLLRLSNTYLSDSVYAVDGTAATGHSTAAASEKPDETSARKCLPLAVVADSADCGRGPSTDKRPRNRGMVETLPPYPWKVSSVTYMGVLKEIQYEEL